LIALLILFYGRWYLYPSIVEYFVSNNLKADRCIGPEHRGRYPAITQESAHLADQCGSMIDQSLPRAVKRLDVLLFEGLLRHEPHVPLLYRSADRLGVITVFFCGARTASKLRGHDLHDVTELLELPLPKDCADGGFDARRHDSSSPKTFRLLFPANPTYQDGASLPVDSVELEDVLCQVDTWCVNFHC
jgi:hypothetical protein